MNADCQVVQQYEDTSRRREEVVPRDGIHSGGGRAAACLSSYRSMVIHEVTAGPTADGRTLAAATVHPSEPSVRPRPLSVFRLPSELFDNDKFMLASERARGRRPIRTSAAMEAVVNANEALT